MDVEKKYRDLIDSYLNFKPILQNLFLRNGNNHIIGILNEIRALNDHVARCYRTNIYEADIFEELCKAEGHLKRLIYDSFKQLNIIFHDYTLLYESKHFGPHWIILDKGEFWNRYTALRQQIMEYVEQAKNLESMDSELAFATYQKAYVNQEQVYDLLTANKSALELSTWSKLINIVNSNGAWLLSTIALTLIPIGIWELISRWDDIINWCVNLLK